MSQRVKRIKLPSVMEIYVELLEEPEKTWPTLTYIDDDEVEHTVIDAGQFWTFMRERFPNFRYEDHEAMKALIMRTDYDRSQAVNNFANAWSNFLYRHPEYKRIAKMMDRTDYDPLENYDRKEDGGWEDLHEIGERQRTIDDDSIHKMQYAEVTTTTENDPKIKTKTTGSVYGDNSATAVPDTESITEPVRDDPDDVDTITTTTPQHTDESSVEGDHVTTDAETSDTDTRTFQDYHVHGNIGVTTAAQMIEGEIKVREKYNLVVRILEAFSREVLTLRKEVVDYEL